MNSAVEDALPILGAIMILGLLAVGGMWLSANACKAQARSFESFEWGPVQGCMVLHRGRWLPLDNIRGFDDKG